MPVLRIWVIFKSPNQHTFLKLVQTFASVSHLFLLERAFFSQLMVCDSLASTMEISNFYASTMKPRLNRSLFFHNGTVSDIKELSSLPCSFINRFGVLHHLSSPSMKQYNLVLARSFGRENEIQFLPGQQHFNLQTGQHTPLGRASSSYLLRRCQVKPEDSEGTLSGEKILLNEQALEQELQFAIKEENYAEAAKIRDSLQALQEDIKASVLAANARFYNSFRNGDVAAMQALWAKGEHVCIVHPGVSGISGYDLVMGSWEFVWADYEFPLEIEIKDVQVHVRGDIGYVTCIELVKTKGSSWGKQFATNVFERIDDQWFICNHHASYVDL